MTRNSSDCQNSEILNIDKTTVLEVLAKIDTKTLSSVCFLHKNLTYLYNTFVSHFKVIEASGGVVYNDKKELLFIFRNGKWDLPKGKIEKGESIENAALREVAEECGVTDLKLGNFIDKTYHIYTFKNQYALKITHWFEMSCSNQKLTPQTEEDITKAVFLNDKVQKEVLKNTYKNLALLLRKYNKK